MKHKSLISLLFCGIVFTACEKLSVPDLSNDDNQPENVENGYCRLHIKASPFTLLPFETRAVALTDVSKRISFSLFNKNGERVMSTISQTSDNENYGSIDAKLAIGEYVIVVVAHNGDANCTISSPTTIKFNNNLVTDTFVACDTINVTGSEQTATITLNRCVAMIRLLLDKALATDVGKIKFYYTGGSSTLDASTGYGCVDSRQTVVVNVPQKAYETDGYAFECYTFPHAESGVLKMTISALTANDEVIAEQIIEGLPVKVNQITQFSCDILNSEQSADYHIQLTVNSTDWTISDYTF